MHNARVVLGKVYTLLYTNTFIVITWAANLPLKYGIVPYLETK